MKNSFKPTVTDSIQSVDLIESAYIEHHPSVLSYIVYKINNSDKAEDLAQDVFVRLIEYKQMLRPETVKSFIYTISRNLVIDYLRCHARIKEFSTDMNEYYNVSSNNDLMSELQEKDILKLESVKMHMLSPQRKNVYMLSRFECLTVDEISTTLKISRNTVECHLLSSRKSIREYIRKCI